jgi:UMF1 family MFS transporter
MDDIMAMSPKKKAIWGWALYDWANSAFATTVMSGFFPIFFKEFWSYGANVNLSTARLGMANALGSLIVALMAPILGAVADKSDARKKFLIFFAYLGTLMTASLFLVGKGQWVLAVFCFCMGTIGFSGANIFYDALLPSVTGKDRIHYVSSLGFSMGYLGGGVLFLINVLMTLHPSWFGLADAAMAIRWSFLSVALWWGGFTIITIIWVPKGKTIQPAAPLLQTVKIGFKQVLTTLKEIRRLKMVFLFLLAYWLYIDGVDTIIRMAVDYGMSLGFATNDLILALLIVQFVGFPAALFFGKLGEKWGARKSIFLGIGVYMLVTIYSTFMSQKIDFYILAVVIGLVQGGIQALSRSYYAGLIPSGREAEFYGFYNMLGKFAAILGPALMAIVGLIARRLLMPAAPTPEQVVEVGRLASRFSIGSILILFILGALLFYFVDEDKAREDLDRF